MAMTLYDYDDYATRVHALLTMIYEQSSRAGDISSITNMLLLIDMMMMLMLIR